MKISLQNLRNYIDLDTDIAKNKELFEDIGLEVKNIETLANDTLITFELLANRGDHHSYEGVAREVSGRTGGQLKQIPMTPMRFEQESSKFSIDTDGCIAYSLTEFLVDGKTNGEPLKRFSHMLHTGGVNEICPVIDVTNVVNLELGQPAHVYDADKIKGKIFVRESKEGEKADLLFQKGEVALPAGITVIADEEKILTIAGIIGCNAASVDENTTRVLFEAALFDPVKIRKASKKLGIQTLASQRFERGGDVDVIKRAVQRAANLYETIGWRSTGVSHFEQKVKLPERIIKISVDEVSKYLDRQFTAQEITEILARYGFVSQPSTDQNLVFKVPMHRIWDVEYPVDLYEELCKSVGYNQLPNMMPTAEIGAVPTQSEKNKAIVDDYLVNQGFYEIFTDSLYSVQHFNKMGVAKEEALGQHVNITNAQDKGYSMLKNNCLIQAVELVEKNLRQKNKDIKAYEWTRVFIPDDKADNKVCREQKMLWGIVNGNALPWHYSYKSVKADPVYLKGIVDGIAKMLRVDLHLRQFKDDTNAPMVSKMLHPLRRMGVLDDAGHSVGVFGEIHPRILAAFGIKSERPCYFELDSDKLLSMQQMSSNVSELAAGIPVVRDICLEVPERYPAGSIITDIKAEKTLPVIGVELIDIYNDATCRKITYTIKYMPKDNKFTAEDVNNWTSLLKSKMEEKIKTSR